MILNALLLGVEPSDYNLVFDRIYHALEEIRSELKVGAAKSVFHNLRQSMWVSLSTWIS
jgi:hypothetical protein